MPSTDSPTVSELNPASRMLPSQFKSEPASSDSKSRISPIQNSNKNLRKDNLPPNDAEEKKAQLTIALDELEQTVESLDLAQGFSSWHGFFWATKLAKDTLVEGVRLSSSVTNDLQTIKKHLDAGNLDEELPDNVKKALQNLSLQGSEIKTKVSPQLREYTKSLRLVDFQLKIARNLGILLLLAVTGLLPAAQADISGEIERYVELATIIAAAALSLIVMARRLLSLKKIQLERITIYGEAVTAGEKEKSLFAAMRGVIEANNSALRVNSIDRQRNIWVSVIYAASFLAAVSVGLFRKRLAGQWLAIGSSHLEAALGFFVPGFALLAIVASLYSTVKKIKESEQEIKNLAGKCEAIKQAITALNKKIRGSESAADKARYIKERDELIKQYREQIIKARERKQKLQMFILDAAVFAIVLVLQTAALVATAGQSEIVTKWTKLGFSAAAILATVLLYSYNSDKKKKMAALKTERIWGTHILQTLHKFYEQGKNESVFELEKNIANILNNEDGNSTAEDLRLILSAITTQRQEEGISPKYQALLAQVESYCDGLRQIGMAVANKEQQVSADTQTNIYDNLQQGASLWQKFTYLFNRGVLQASAESLTNLANQLNSDSVQDKLEEIVKVTSNAKNSVGDGYAQFFYEIQHLADAEDPNAFANVSAQHHQVA